MTQENPPAKPIHIPVLPTEIVSFLNISTDGIDLDGTVGLGGHAKLIANQLSPNGHFIGIDRDEAALAHCKQTLSGCPTPVSLIHDSYHNFSSILDNLEIDSVNGMVLDLGLSSLQLDSIERGFSYTMDADLDMRFDSNQSIKASDVLNQTHPTELANIIYEYGEERRSRQIAKSIERMRPLSTVFNLVEAIRRCTPANHRGKTLARVFQAIRIKVNGELDKLNLFLSSFQSRLALGGRVAIISFHSLEDRMVKHAFRSMAKEGVLRLLTKKPIIASEEEQKQNRRSRSAKLRVAERIQ